MGKTKDPFNKIGDTKGIFHAKMGIIKDRKSKDVTEAEKNRSERQWRKGKIYPSECRVPKNSKER